MWEKSAGEAHPSGPGSGCEDERCPQTAGDKVWYCVDCSCHFCESCWKFQPSHKTGKTARDGLSHEKINYYVAKRLEAILSPTNDHDEVRRLHEVDERSIWFGDSSKQTCTDWLHGTSLMLTQGGRRTRRTVPLLRILVHMSH
jgi:hypothetical protein